MTPPEHDVLRIETIPVEACSDGTVVAMVTINRPNKLNALNADVTSAIKEMIAWVESEDLVRCVIMTGAQPLKPDVGKRAKPNAFVAGADITEFLGAGSEEIASKFTDNAIEALWNVTKPTIAMVDGSHLEVASKLLALAIYASQVHGQSSGLLKSILDSSLVTVVLNDLSLCSVMEKLSRWFTRAR